MKRFYFFLLKTDHFWGFNAIFKQVKTDRKNFRLYIIMNNHLSLRKIFTVNKIICR